VPNFAPKADAAETAQRRSNRQTAGGALAVTKAPEALF